MELLNPHSGETPEKKTNFRTSALCLRIKVNSRMILRLLPAKG